MADFTGEDLAGSRFEMVDLTGALFHNVDLTGAVIRGALLVNVDISGEIQDVRINGVDVVPLIEAELDRRYPDRATMRPADADGYRQAWDILERLWQQTVARARGMAPELLHERVNDEWSFIETLRHLVFATNAWVRRDPGPAVAVGSAGPAARRDVRPAVRPARQSRPAVAGRGSRAARGPHGYRTRGDRRAHRRHLGRDDRTGHRARLPGAGQFSGTPVPAGHTHRGMGAPPLRRTRP